MCSLPDKKITLVTTDFTSSWSPVFDPAGKYLYFFSARDYNKVLGAYDFEFTNPNLITFAVTILAMTFDKELAIAQSIAAQAGRLAVENRSRGFDTETKSDDSPVTSADRANEQLITKLLTEAFPDDGLLGEEGAQREGRSGRRWIVDPIDGTRSFIRSIPTWGVMLALEAEGSVVVGACNLPVLGELYSAAVGMGAYRNGARIHCSPAKTPDQAMLCLTGIDKVVRWPWADRWLPWITQFWSVPVWVAAWTPCAWPVAAPRCGSPWKPKRGNWRDSKSSAKKPARASLTSMENPASTAAIAC